MAIVVLSKWAKGENIDLVRSRGSNLMPQPTTSIYSSFPQRLPYRMPEPCMPDAETAGIPPLPFSALRMRLAADVPC